MKWVLFFFSLPPAPKECKTTWKQGENVPQCHLHRHLESRESKESEIYSSVYFPFNFFPKCQGNFLVWQQMLSFSCLPRSQGSRKHRNLSRNFSLELSPCFKYMLAECIINNDLVKPCSWIVFINLLLSHLWAQAPTTGLKSIQTIAQGLSFLCCHTNTLVLIT